MSIVLQVGLYYKGIYNLAPDQRIKMLDAIQDDAKKNEATGWKEDWDNGTAIVTGDPAIDEVLAAQAIKPINRYPDWLRKIILSHVPAIQFIDEHDVYKALYEDRRMAHAKVDAINDDVKKVEAEHADWFKNWKVAARCLVCSEEALGVEMNPGEIHTQNVINRLTGGDDEVLKMLEKDGVPRHLLEHHYEKVIELPSPEAPQKAKTEEDAKEHIAP